MDGFTLVHDDKLEIDPNRYCICDHCGARVETGIFNLADHWSKCFGKEEFEFMKSDPLLYLETKKQSIKTDTYE